MHMVVRDLMTNDPAKIHFETTIDEAIKIMMAQCASEIFVVDSGNFLRGAVPEVEILKAELNGIDGQSAIDTITSRSIATVTPDEPVTVLIPRFRTGYCRQLAVIEKGKLIGQIQRRDVIRLIHTLRRLELSVSDISGMQKQPVMPDSPVDSPEKVNDIPAPNFMQKTKPEKPTGLFSNSEA